MDKATRDRLRQRQAKMAKDAEEFEKQQKGVKTRIDKGCRQTSGVLTGPSEPPPAAQADLQPAAEDTITYKCGHTKPLSVFRAADCSGCREKVKQQKARLRKQKWQEKVQAKRQAVPAGGRLPDGSAFHVEYDAATQTWSGTLTTTITTQQSHTFEDTASAVFTLLGKLDAQYRKTLNEGGSHDRQSQGE